MRALLFVISCLVLANQAVARGYFEKCTDPKTGMIYLDKCSEPYTGSRSFPAPEPAESEKIKSIESRGNDIIFKFGDGSEKVFISDPFHPEKGYKPKY
ncbi:hypothetical protein [uncultured Parasutterella sp.]|uniref:hypothetical protein n=1 Tax=uncultured Parasutterella sp. TaxID=1263098 RepID=UPI002593CE38|nr:hypothetical protein [uncultured Parasutterella sp.]